MPRKLVVAVVLLFASLFIWDKMKARHKSVPLAVSATIAHFAPGIAIGSSVEESAKSLNGAAWVRNLGFVGALSGRRGFSQARLLVEPDERGKAAGDMQARVTAVELVGSRSDSIAPVMFDLSIAFRGNPVDGCIIPAVEGIPHRRVQYWSTRSDAGGVALITDWITPQDSVKPSQVVVWSILAWSGPFQGSRTLLANYDARTCLDITGRPTTTAAAASDAVASETAQLAFRDALRAEEAAQETRTAAGATPLVGGEAAEACSPGAVTAFVPQSNTLFEIDVPADFVARNRDNAERAAMSSGYARYEWSAPDGSTLAVFAVDSSAKVHSGWTGAISSECDVESISGPMHVDIANASVSGPDRVVHAILRQPMKQSLVILGHARSLQRQSELLRAARTIRISPRWGQRSRG